MTPEVSPSAPAGAQAPVTVRRKTTTAVSVGIYPHPGRHHWLIATTQPARSQRWACRSWMAKAASPDSPLHVEADARYNGTAFSLVADTGSLSRLQDPAATSPWPVKVALTVVAAKLAADGAMTQPLQGKGYDSGGQRHRCRMRRR